jgi:hypothetical protein
MRHEIHRVLKHPAYKGTYLYGQEKNDGSVNAKGRRGRVKRAMDEWVCIENHHESYVSPEVWEQIQDRLRSNRNQLKGPLGRGDALVQGILKCVVHRRGFTTFYSVRERQHDGTMKRVADYRCVESSRTGLSSLCGCIRAKLLDPFIERALIESLRPPSIALIERAAREALREYDTLVAARANEVWRAEQTVREIERALDQTDQTQLLVRQRFSDRLESALREQKALAASHKLHPIHPPFVLDDAEIRGLRRLLDDLPLLWRHPNVTSEQRKRLIRTAIHAVHARTDPEMWQFEIEWVGGARTAFSIYTRKAVRIEVQQARDQGLTIPKIVERLRENGFVMRKGAATGTPYTERDVKEVIRGFRRRNAGRSA